MHGITCLLTLDTHLVVINYFPCYNPSQCFLTLLTLLTTIDIFGGYAFCLDIEDRSTL